MRHRREHHTGILAIAAMAALVLGVSAIGPLSSGAIAAVRAQSLPKCPVGALAKHSGAPVEITMWHSMTEANEPALEELAAAFNSSQKKVRVNLVNQTSYDDTIQKYRAALGGGKLPDVVQIEDTGLQQMIDSQSTIPAAACAKADRYKFRGWVKRVLDYYTVEGVLYPMPFNVSNPVLYYNKQAFEKAGLDPDVAPATLKEITAASEKVVQSGATTFGYAIKTDPWYLEQWLAKAGKPYVNNGNGRKARATTVVFDNPTGVEIATWMQQMVNRKLALDVGYAVGNFDNIFAFGNGNAAMTIETSAALGTMKQVKATGAFPNVTIGVAPMPGPKGRGGVLVGGAGNYVVSTGSAKREAAAWEWVKFLTEPENQARWAAATGYVPLRTASPELSPLREKYESDPDFKIAYDQLITGVNNVATAGPVIGAYKAVRDAVVDGFSALLTQGKKPKAMLRDAAREGDAAIQEYNSRVS